MKFSAYDTVTSAGDDDLLLIDKYPITSTSVKNITVSNLFKSIPDSKSRTVTKTVGPAGSVADYVCDGVADDVEINAAITAVNAAGGGEIRLRASTFNIAAPISLASNIILRGEGFNTVLKGISGLTIGVIADTTNSLANVVLQDFTVDCNNLVSKQGIYIKTFNGLVVERVKVKNVSTTWGFHFGTIVTDEATNKCNNLVWRNCVVDGHSGGSLECSILSDVNNFEVDNIRFLNVTTTSRKIFFYTWNRHGVVKNMVLDQDQTKYITMVLGSDITFENCTFINSATDGTQLTINNSSDIRIRGCYFENTANGNSILQYDNNSAIDGAWPLGTDTISRRISIIGCHFKYGYEAIKFQGQTQADKNIAHEDVRITGCDFLDYTFSAISVGYTAPTQAIVNTSITNNTFRRTLATASQALRVNGSTTYNVTTINVSDNQFISTAGNGGFLTSDFTTDLQIGRNQVTPSGTGVGLTITNDTSTSTVNNSGINPVRLYALGNATSATTFNRLNGDHQTATLTGNITVTLTAGKVKGDMLDLELTQDGTGSRTATWPANFKKAGGTLTLTTTAGATDVISMRYDGTNWIETARSLNVS